VARLTGARPHIHVDVQGPPDAPAIIFSNSLGATLEMWDGQVQALSAEWRVVRYDTRGHGRSEVLPAPYRLEDLAGDVIHVLDSLGIGRAHYCGLSLGAMTGLYLGIHHPARFSKLVLVAGGAKMGSPELWNSRISGVMSAGVASISGSVIARWFTEGFIKSDSEVVRKLETSLKGISAQGYAGCCAALRDTDLEAVVPRIPNHALVVAGTHDPAFTAAQCRALAAKMQHVEYTEFPTAHIVNVEARQAFNDRLIAFLRS